MKKIPLYLIVMFGFVFAQEPHFQTVWSGNPFNPFIMFLLDAQLDGVTLDTGDEIAAFDGDLCVGIFVMPEEGIVPGSSTITNSMNDGTGNGYTVGNIATLKIWDTSAGVEISDVTIEWYDLVGNPIDPLPFAGGEMCAINVFGFAAPTNLPPVADAGSDQTIEVPYPYNPAEVTLNGSGSYDSDGTILSWEWTWAGGTASGATPTASFGVGVHTVTLTVTDDDDATATDEVIITVVEAPNVAPVANAGPDQTIEVPYPYNPAEVTLNGSGSYDSDGTIVSWEWTWAGGTASGATPTASFGVGTHTVTLTVTDDDDATGTDEVIITVIEAPNIDPIVDAGEDQTVEEGELVQLNGSGSDVEGPVTFMWTADPAIVFDDPTLSNASFIAPEVDVDTDFTLTLTVTDNNSATASDNLIVTVLNVEVPVIDNITLAAGWNLISLDVLIEANNDSVHIVFADLIADNNLITVTGFDEGALFFDPGIPFFLNTLKRIYPGFGYWVKVNNTTTLAVEGLAMGNDYPINLNTGWSLVSYHPSFSQAPADAFAELIAYGNLIYVTGFDNGALFFDPTIPQFNTLLSLDNGFGYWVKVYNAVPGFIYSAASRTLVGMVTRESNPEIIKTNEFMFVNGKANFNDIPFRIGDMVEIRTQNGLLVGEMEILEDNLLMTSPIYGDDWTTEEIDGALIGERLSFIYNGYKATTGVIYNGTMDLQKIILEFKIIPEVYALSQNYPNPFNAVTTINYELPAESHVNIAIFNVRGEKIKELISENQSKGHHSLHWYGINQDGDPVSSGIYLYAIVTEEFQAVKKMLLVK